MTDVAVTAQEAPSANEIVAANVRAELARLSSRPSLLARAMGNGDMWLSRRLRSEVAFSTNEVQQIADLLGVNVGTLFIEQRPTKKTSALLGGGRSVHPLGLEPRTHWIRAARASSKAPRGRHDPSTGPARRAA